MTDLIKGILIGIVVVKVYESDTVQNYIHKAIRKKGREVGKAIADAVFPVKEENKDKPDHGRYPYRRNYECDNSGNSKREWIFVRDANGQVWNVPKEELFEARRVTS